LLVGYAPLIENLYSVLAEYTADDQRTKPLGRDLDEAMARVRDLLDTIGNVILAGYDWRAVRSARSARSYLNAVAGTVNYLRDPATPGNQPAEGEPTLGDRFRSAAAKLARFYALCSSHKEMRDHRDEIAFFEEIRVWMAKADADDRRARGLPVPADAEMYLRQLTTGAVEAGDITDLYEAAGIPRPDLSHLDAPFHRADAAEPQPAPGH
jgi:type I restriction enzyme R subunit